MPGVGISRSSSMAPILHVLWSYPYVILCAQLRRLPPMFPRINRVHTSLRQGWAGPGVASLELRLRRSEATGGQVTSGRETCCLSAHHCIIKMPYVKHIIISPHLRLPYDETYADVCRTHHLNMPLNLERYFDFLPQHDMFFRIFK